MNVVSRISGIEMPSTPSVVPGIEAPIHGSLLDELHRGRRRCRNRVHSSVAQHERRRRSRASASQRPSATRCARRAAAAATPPAIGSQISTLRMGQSSCMAFRLRHRSTYHASSADKADDHRERVVVEVAGLQLAQPRPRPSRPARAEPLTACAVDQRDIADAPQRRAEAAAAARRTRPG